MIEVGENVNAKGPNCPLCAGQLEVRGDGFWCEHQKRQFSTAQIRKNEEWAKLQRGERIQHHKALGRDRLSEEYCLSEAQIREVETWVNEDATAVEIKRADVSPEKEALLSLARGLNDGASLCELVDNALDAGTRREGAIEVEIKFDPGLRTLSVSDNAGGMSAEELQSCLTLGAINTTNKKKRIGRYGIGAKEAIYHFGREVTIKSRLPQEAKSIRTIVQEDWLKEREWKIKIESFEGLKPGTTVVEIGRLVEDSIDDDLVRGQLWETYERRLKKGDLSIEFNGALLNERFAKGSGFNVLYPEALFPRTYTMKAGTVLVEVRVMLISVSDQKAGIAFYVHGRKFAHVGWDDPQSRLVFDKVPKQNQIKHVRVEIDFDGPIDDVPISANKDEVHMNGVLAIVGKIASKVVDPYFKAIPILAQKGADKIKQAIELPPGFVEKTIDLGRVFETTKIPDDKKADIQALKDWVDPPVKSPLTDQTQPTPPPPPTQPTHPPPEPKSTAFVKHKDGSLPKTPGSPKQLSLLLLISEERTDAGELREWLDRGVELGVLQQEQALDIVRGL